MNNKRNRTENIFTYKLTIFTRELYTCNSKSLKSSNNYNRLFHPFNISTILNITEKQVKLVINIKYFSSVKRQTYVAV